MKKKFPVKMVVSNAIICALYVVLTLVCGNLSFLGGFFQLRLSEILNLLVFFNPYYLIGISLGCLVSNIFSMYGFLDLIIGTFATIASGFIMIFVSKSKKLLLTSIVPIFVNALIVPLVFFVYDQSIASVANYLVNLMFVALGEIICVIVGYLLIMLLNKKHKILKKLLVISQNEDFKW